QTKEFIASRKSATGKIQVYTAIPHISAPESSGTIVTSVLGDTPEITRIEGQGNGGLELDITLECEEIIIKEPYTAYDLKYRRGAGPIKVKVIDPLSIEKGTYILKFLVPSTSTGGPSLIRIVSKDTRWVLLDKGTMDTV